MSPDGFIAGPNDEIDPLNDWVFSGETASRYNEFFKPVGNSREVLDETIETRQIATRIWAAAQYGCNALESMLKEFVGLPVANAATGPIERGAASISRKGEGTNGAGTHG